MTKILVLLIIFGVSGFCETPDELPSILVEEWGVLTWSNGDPLLSSSPPVETPFPTVPDPLHPAVRAPVLYFNGPEFTGTVTVRTDNGSIFDIYPPVPAEYRTHKSCTWVADFAYSRHGGYSDNRGMGPGEWNMDLWRVEHAMGISCLEGWYEKFLYYETAPENTSFLPYSPGAESVHEEYRETNALVIRRRSDGVFYSRSTLGDLVTGADMEYRDMDPDGVMNIIYQWSTDIIDPFQVDALWRTWAPWILRDHAGEPAYASGMVIYMIPGELTQRLSTITVTPDPEGPAFPVNVSRFLLVAVPL